MKTVKSTIVVLFVLLTAQIASAYYCPSTGRWLSRDPIGEPGFQNSQRASVVRSIAGSAQLVPSRWISRDPLGEESSFRLPFQGKKKADRWQLRWDGLQPTHLFVRNNPLDYRDVLGLALGNPMCGAYGCTFDPAPMSPCEKAIMDAKNDLGNVNNDKRAHCVHSCEIAKACGKRVCKCLGTLKESRDLTFGAVEWTCSWVLPKAAENWLHNAVQGGNVDDSAGDFAANDWGMSVAATGGDCVKDCEARYGSEQ